MTAKKFKVLPLAAAITCAYLSGFAQYGEAADARIEEVFVTAQKQEENIQTIPLAITAMTGDDLANRGIGGLEGIVKATPSLSFSQYPSSNMLILYMRGQGVSDPGQITFDGSVGLYQDGFYISRPQGVGFDLADIERVEVLRGPQGTLYGRNTTGGAVNLISKAPTGEFGFKQTLSFGTLNEFRSVTTIDLPSWNDVAAKVSFLKSSRDGYVKNAGSSHDFGENAQTGARLAVNWRAAPDFDVDYFVEFNAMDYTSSYFQNASLEGLTILGYPYTKAGSPRDRTYRPIDLEPAVSRSEAHGLTLTWDVNDNLSIKSLTGYRKLSWNSYQDYAESLTAGYRQPIVNTAADHVDDHQFSQELQFVGNALDGRINYVAGLYYFDEGASHLNQGAIPTYSTTKYRFVEADSNSKAAFGQVTWTPDILDDRLELTLGARYTKDKRSASRVFIINDVVLENGSASGAENDQSFSKFNPSFTINYSWSDELSTYAKVSTGYKAGGSSESGLANTFNLTFGPENVTVYELGLKSYWFDKRLRLNVAAFDSKIDDMQMAFIVNPLDGSYTQGYNAGKASIRGFEAEATLIPIDDLTLSVNYTYLDPDISKVEALAGTIFDPAKNSASPYRVGDNIKNLFSMPYTAKNAIDLAADYAFLHFDGGSVMAHLDYRFQSAIYQSAPTGPGVPNADYFERPSYGVLNGRLTLALDLPRGDHAKISLWGRNLGNKRYKQQVIGQGAIIPTWTGSAVRAPGYESQSVVWSEPASYGVELNYEY